MNRRTQEREITHSASRTSSILQGFGPNPLIGSPAWPTPPELFPGGHSFVGLLVADPHRRGETARGAERRSNYPGLPCTEAVW
jgi:hypothetical protein